MSSAMEAYLISSEISTIAMKSRENIQDNTMVMGQPIINTYYLSCKYVAQDET